MPPLFECPACGGLIEYPPEDEITVDDEFTVICAWCKKRVDVPLDLPPVSEAYYPPALSTSTDDDKAMDASSWSLWPRTRRGRIILGALLLVYLGPAVLGTIIWLLGYY
jgi:hypothetical protein